jgi:putative flippase GtrA
MRMNRPIIKYFFVALAGLFVDYIVLLASVEYLNFSPVLGAINGFIFGLIVNYYLSTRFVFINAKIKSTTINFVAFGLIGLAGLLILTTMMWLQVELLEINYIIAKTIATVLVYFWNFFARAKLYHETR